MTHPTDHRWTLAPLHALSVNRVYALLRLRAEVFVVEQTCPYLDLDGKDLMTGVTQLFAELPDGSMHACLRIVPPGLAFDEPALGRVATSRAARGSGLGRELLRRGIEGCTAQYPGQAIRIGAQAYLIPFYASFGFDVDSEPYDEDGIPHVEMLRGA